MPKGREFRAFVSENVLYFGDKTPWNLVLLTSTVLRQKDENSGHLTSMLGKRTFVYTLWMSKGREFRAFCPRKYFTFWGQTPWILVLCLDTVDAKRTRIQGMLWRFGDKTPWILVLLSWHCGCQKDKKSGHLDFENVWHFGDKRPEILSLCLDTVDAKRTRIQGILSLKMFDVLGR